MTQPTKKPLGSSFRDPSGFIFKQENAFFRQINNSYKENYDLLMKSGFYDELVSKKLLIEHEETPAQNDASFYKIIKPRKAAFISYPYEWTFGQLKDAALSTLAIQKIAMKHGMSLKDASAFNIQFISGRPTLIDTLSFEKYDQTKPWVAYKQFCQHFIAPLALMSKVDVRLIRLFDSFIDGIPLDLASGMLPKSTYLNPSVLMHIHLHAKSQKHYANKGAVGKSYKMNQYAMQGLIASLIKATAKMKWKQADTEWGKYYSFTNYSDKAFKQKKKLIEDFVDKLPRKPKLAWDLGGNTGLFSRILSNKKIETVSFDIDYLAVEKNYRQAKKAKETHILPLFLDLTNPSSSLGWAHKERDSLQKRGRVDLCMALALIHHICISNNVPFSKVASYLQKLCKNLIIEFVPKEDSNAQKLLATREDIFGNYNKKSFEKEFSKYFKIEEIKDIEDSKRTLYLMKSLS